MLRVSAADVRLHSVSIGADWFPQFISTSSSLLPILCLSLKEPEVRTGANHLGTMPSEGGHDNDSAYPGQCRLRRPRPLPPLLLSEPGTADASLLGPRWTPPL